MNDKELLELAAKAAGYQLSEEKAVWGYNDLAGEDVLLEYLAVDGEQWNPLEDDGDAFRLLVAIKENRPELSIGSEWVMVETWKNAYSIELTDDPSAAMRRAIVMAAADLAPDVGASEEVVGKPV